MAVGTSGTARGGKGESESRLEGLLFAKVEVWVVVACGLVGLFVLLSFGWLVQDSATGGKLSGALGRTALAVARIPSPIVRLLDGEAVAQPQRLAFTPDAELEHFAELSRQDDGTLLVASYSDEHEVSVATLYDLSSQTVLHTWVPPVSEIRAATRFRGVRNEKRNYRTQHPLLLEDGDLVISSGEGPLVRIDACGGLVWAIDRHFHHSIERDADGNLLVPHVVRAETKAVPVQGSEELLPAVRDDGFAKVSPDGRILQEWSVTDILRRHGHDTLLYGVGPWEADRIHLNDVEPILETDDYVREGDVALSIRHLSTVMLYRPSTDQILWIKTGPWLNQHDVDYQGNGVFTIFGNDSFRGAGAEGKAHRGHSTIWQYDQKSDQVQPFLSMDDPVIYTATQGVHRVLPDGDVFVEEQNAGRLHRLNDEGLVWSFVSRLDEAHIGALHWSRYLTKAESDFPWLRDLRCEAKGGQSS